MAKKKTMTATDKKNLLEQLTGRVVKKIGPSRFEIGSKKVEKENKEDGKKK